MERTLKRAVVCTVATMLLCAGCGGSGWLVELDPLQWDGPVTEVYITATASMRAAMATDLNVPGLSKDVTATCMGYGGGIPDGDDDDIYDIEESVGGYCDFGVQGSTFPNYYIDVFDSRSGFNCETHALNPERCIDCEVTKSDGLCWLSCHGKAPKDATTISEVMGISVYFHAIFKKDVLSPGSMISIDGSCRHWEEIDLLGEDDLNGFGGPPEIDLSECSGGDDFMKADMGHRSSWEEILEDEWHREIAIVDPGQDKDADGLTNCYIKSWVTGFVSLADVVTTDTLEFYRGPITWTAKLCNGENDLDCDWEDPNFEEVIPPKP